MTLDRVKIAKQEAAATFVADVGRSLSGMAGDVDEIYERFVTKHNRNTAQAVMLLLKEIEEVRARAESKERNTMRKEAGFAG